MVSEKFRAAIKLDRRRAYRIAQQAGVHPCTLSKLINGIEDAKAGDARVLAVARVVGISAEEAFSEKGEETVEGERKCQG